MLTNAERKEALAAAVERELAELKERGVRMAGNAFSPIVLIKGALNDDERMGGALLAGADGDALRSALAAIGWQPQDFCVLSAVSGASADGVAGKMVGEPLAPVIFREALETLDPEAVVTLDLVAADMVREAYAESLAAIDDFDAAMLRPGLIVHLLGRRVLSLDGFEDALSDPAEKQRMWAYLKQLPPLGAPY